MPFRLLVCLLALSAAACGPRMTPAPTAASPTRLPLLFQDGMVLQRDVPIPVWGWAPPGSPVAVSLAGRTETTTADSTGAWSVRLPQMSAGGPHTLRIQSAGGPVTIQDVLVGDVWVASGQSNMEWPLSQTTGGAVAIAAARDPMIREFAVPHTWSEQPEQDLAGGSWKPATPENAGSFSAVAYHFARDLRQHVGVPIGIIHTSWGGANIETWMSRQALGLSDSAWNAVMQRERERTAAIRDSLRTRLGDLPTTDAGLVNGRAVWADPALDDSGWRTLPVPSLWENAGLEGMDGTAWYRTTFNLSEQEARQGVRLSLGPIDDNDITWVNGVEVGRTDGHAAPRVYTVPASALRAGRNVLAVRVVDTGGGGGPHGTADQVYVELGGERRSLAGQWKFRVGAVTVEADGQRINKIPSVLYNRMIHPLLRYPIKGAIWYQGESNAGTDAQAVEYRRLFANLIQGWRREWGQGDFPFLWVQLPNFGTPDTIPPQRAAWATIRESQTAALELPNTGQVVAIDLGDPGDIHPRNKQPVGERLARVARKVAYGEDLVASGPTYRRHTVRDGRVEIEWDNVGGGLVSRAPGASIPGFAIAGEDRRWRWAQARLEGDKVVVWSPQVPRPVAVRYLWGNSPRIAPLFNREGLPARPFRTDSWPVTQQAAVAEGTAADHRRMMDLLGIRELRPGPSGNPQAPNAANADESKATTYTSLPDPLVTERGQRVRTADQWWRVRRPEIVALFDREVYGRVPRNVPKVSWTVASTTRDTVGQIPVVVKKLIGRVDNSAYPEIDVNIDLTLTTPANATGPVPVMINLGFQFPPGFRPPGAQPAGPTWQQQVLANGWGYAVLIPTSVQADNGAGLRQGIIGLANRGQPRKPDDWGALRAWAWGVSRALDYLETDPAVDAKQVGIEGLSRYGKAALVAMAYEPRLAIGFIGSSGAGGAKILRRNLGEQVENLASSGEYHWFAGNFLKYAGPLTANDLPVDAHQLVALAAPRPVFISVGSPTVEGQWVDARGMFLAGVHASPVYELLGKRGLQSSTFPPMETALLDGEIAFRQHSGGHTTGPNWPTFLEYANRYLKAR